MRKSRFTEAQIIGMIKEQEAGLPTVEVCRKHGLSTATFYKRNRCTDPTWDVERLQCTVRVLAKAHWSWMKEMIWGIIRQVSARA